MLKRLFVLSLLVVAVYFATLFAHGHQEHILKTDLLDEASGLARSITNPGILYSHNDSGGKNAVYAIDTKGELVATILLKGLRNRDWEDIATAYDPITKKPYIFVGEIGDNRAHHSYVSVIKFPEPRILASDTLIVVDDYQIIQIQYEDGAKDAEALFIEPKSGDIYIISKREENVGVYHIPYPQKLDEINIAKRVASMRMGWVTAADISPNGKYILVKNYTSIKRFKVRRRQSIASALSGKGKAMPYKIEPQGEAVCFDWKGKGYFTLSEASGENSQILYYYK